MMDTIINSSGLTITAREKVYETAQGVFYRTLHNSPAGQPGRDFLKDAEISKQEAVEMRLGFAFDGSPKYRQADILMKEGGFNIESLAWHRMIRFQESETQPLRFYHCFRNCIMRPVRLLPPYAEELQQDVIGLVGIPIKNHQGWFLYTPLWSDDRAMSNFEEVSAWASKIAKQNQIVTH